MHFKRRLGYGTWRATAMLALLCLAPFAGRADLWRTGYFPGWEQTTMPATNLDFGALTHIIHFAVVPAANGTLDGDANVVPAIYSADLIKHAHAAGLKVLICVGGGGTENLFLNATTNAAILPVFIGNLTNFMATRGYDGIDVDWEPFPIADARAYTNLIYGLRSALNQFPQPKLLTVAVGAYPAFGDPPTNEYQLYAAIQNQLDQINIMTYDLSGPYDGWVTWFNSPLYDGGYRFLSSGGLVPSVNGSVTNFIGNGVASTKLGIGLPFYGYIWTGGKATAPANLTLPRQEWTTTPSATADNYNDLIKTYYKPARYHWDTNAQAAYLSITNAKAVNDTFISYDDARACEAKVSYARNHNLGGIMIWELALDHTNGAPDPLLQAVKQAVAAPGATALQSTGGDIHLTFTGITLGSYRILWSNALSPSFWHTLLVTNVPGTGGTLQIQDPGAITNAPARFYRVQTPP